MMSSKVMTAVVTTKMMSIVMSAVAPGTPVPIAIWRVEPRHIHIGRRLIAIILASPMTATAAMAMSIAAFVSKMYRA